MQVIVVVCDETIGDYVKSKIVHTETSEGGNVNKTEKSSPIQICSNPPRTKYYIRRSDTYAISIRQQSKCKRKNVPK